MTRCGADATSVALDEGVHRELRLASAETRIPLMAIVRTAVNTWLDGYKRRRANR